MSKHTGTCVIRGPPALSRPRFNVYLQSESALLLCVFLFGVLTVWGLKPISQTDPRSRPRPCLGLDRDPA